MIRHVLPHGKALVSKAYLATANERNEYGSFVLERTHPFRSSSSDVHQSVFRGKMATSNLRIAAPRQKRRPTPVASQRLLLHSPRTALKFRLASEYYLR